MDDAEKRAETFRETYGLNDDFFVAEIATMIRDAVAAERERCAETAEWWAELWRDDGDEDGAMAADSIASHIREGGAVRERTVKWNKEQTAYLRQRLADSAKTAVAWSKKPPTVPGRYWYREEGDGASLVNVVSVGVVEDERGLRFQSGMCGEWWPVPVEVPQ